MTKLLIATNNLHKVEEYQEIFADLPVQLTSLAAEGITLDPEETGDTFVANALLKAEAFAEVSGLLTLADDSGLEVDALNGEPGVYSARYGNTPKHDHVARYQLLLEKLKGVPDAERTGRFRCVIALAINQTVIGTVDGRIEGVITREPKGSSGFGYDPVFFVPDLNRTLAELSSAEKHQISHRGRAAQAAVSLIEQFFKGDIPQDGR
ncbi:MAG: RdgB/HAM1 family non-canonical purine NTP pyrophosphatase [Chloroflexota bacterium]